uniref:ANF_receptor domain-containing protein n=1 Tax=Hormiphora californensis TaxID=1403702 RepID=V9PPT9_HORCA|nr:ANF_receptor domain-containing protein [Hormiphora californensis]AQX17748.1 ionotropic glutamate receptor [Hormiphora californensis]
MSLLRQFLILLVLQLPLSQQLAYSNTASPNRVHVGLILVNDEREQLYLNVANMARDQIREMKNSLLRWTYIEIVNRSIGNSPREAVQEACALLEKGVSVIIFPGPSPLVSTVADIANSYGVPVIAPTASDPFLINPSFRPLLLQMPPTDKYQSAAIASILTYYEWIYFSILTSYDSYGINGMLKLQQIASDNNWKIHNTQHFTVPKDLAQMDVSEELNVIKKSEARIIILNCQAGVARIVLKFAEEKGLLDDGYMWIVTDAVVGNQEEFTEKKVSKMAWNGMLGTLPSFRNNVDNMYHHYVVQYERHFKGPGSLDNYDLKQNAFAAMVYDSVFIFAHALNDYLEQGLGLTEMKISCMNTRCVDGTSNFGERDKQYWDYGKKLFANLTKVDYNGASRRYTFNSTGESQNIKFSIMNFQEDSTFKEVGSYEPGFSQMRCEDQNCSRVQFMGGATRKPEYKPKNLKGRKLTLGINVEHPFISERQVTCLEWQCEARVAKEWSATNDQALLPPPEVGECNKTDHETCKRVQCENHSTNCTLDGGPGYNLWCMGRVCTHCNYTEQSPEECQPCEGSECMNCDEITCYHGYCIQLVEKISGALEFNYTFVRPADGKWGGLTKVNGTDVWNGLVKDLLDKRIDIATVHFSINAQREKYIDFSVPFMQVGLAVVVRAEVDGSNEYFFLQPFDPDVWYCVMLSAFLITIIVCVYNKISPYGLYGRKMHALMTCPCGDCMERQRLAKLGSRSLIRWQSYQCLVEEVDNYGEDKLEWLNMGNSAWLVVASLLQQGPVEGAPYCLSGRTILSVWWFFMMILIAMYTANLAAFLTVTRMKAGIEDVEDLLTQNKLKWGTVNSTNPETLLKGSTKEEYKNLAQHLDNVQVAEEGIKRVQEKNYAFIYESAYLEYQVQQACNLVIAGEKFSKFGFAFGFPPNSPHLDLFNNVILQLREKNELDNDWENIKDQARAEVEAKAQSGNSSSVCVNGRQKAQQSTSKLDMKNLSGLFTVIALGVLTSFLFLIAEYTFACFEDVYGNDFAGNQADRPKTVAQAFLRRLKLTWQDILSHWFIFEAFRFLSDEDSNNVEFEEIRDIDSLKDTPSVCRMRPHSVKSIRGPNQ